MTVTEGINIKFNLLGFVIPTERFKSFILTFLYNPTLLLFSVSELPPNILEQLCLYSDGCNSLKGLDCEEAQMEKGDVGIVSAPTLWSKHWDRALDLPMELPRWWWSVKLNRDRCRDH